MWLAVDLTARVVIGGSLILAGLTKLVSTVAWRQLWLAAHRLLPRRFARPAALGLPAAETAVGLAMLSGVLGAASMLAAAALLGLLALGVTVALASDREVSCHCLSMVGEVISWRGVARNAALALLAARCGWPGAAGSGTGWPGGRELLGGTAIGWPGQLLALAAAVVAAHAGAAAVRAARRRRALAAIARRPGSPAAGVGAPGVPAPDVAPGVPAPDVSA